ncbi:hypothetical protein HaLaN_04820 [Haematococcus lacustris]|uniref:Uncharacterized protein n=1 Tax=Haematococcus lacustris TaxID=44745 RepID=A0A699YHG0_HAELA|nr:hypothetical protein HaLaN_04820 [Haematococcus lacustris]
MGLRLYGVWERAPGTSGNERDGQFYKKLEKEMAEVSWKGHFCVQQLVVFFGTAGIGTQGGWGADAMLRASCKVVCMSESTDQRQARVVLVYEFSKSRATSAVNGQQPREEQLDKHKPTGPADWKPLAAAPSLELAL